MARAPRPVGLAAASAPALVLPRASRGFSTQPPAIFPVRSRRLPPPAAPLAPAAPARRAGPARARASRCSGAAGPSGGGVAPAMPSANAKWYRLPNEGLLVLSEGDITSWSGDAVVNAGAHALGRPGGRVVGGGSSAWSALGLGVRSRPKAAARAVRLAAAATHQHRLRAASAGEGAERWWLPTGALAPAAAPSPRPRSQ
jgi:hypothetical protein